MTPQQAVFVTLVYSHTLPRTPEQEVLLRRAKEILSTEARQVKA